MLDRLLESGVQRKKSAWGGAVSVVIHSAIIVLAAVATATGEPAPKFTHDHTHIIAIDPPPASVESRHASRRGNASTATGATAAQIPSVDISTPSFDPILPGTIAIAMDGRDDGTLLSEIGGAGSGPGRPLGASGIVADATVDVPVRALGDRAPAYPEMLRAAGITGAVRVQFVVDTTGRAELSSVRVVESSHELFTRAVLASLRQSRFTPGEVSGRRVRTLVERSFRFDIGR